MSDSEGQTPEASSTVLVLAAQIRPASPGSGSILLFSGAAAAMLHFAILYAFLPATFAAQTRSHGTRHSGHGFAVSAAKRRAKPSRIFCETLSVGCRRPEGSVDRLTPYNYECLGSFRQRSRSRETRTALLVCVPVSPPFGPDGIQLWKTKMTQYVDPK